MSNRPDDQRQTEWTKWVAIFPGASSSSRPGTGATQSRRIPNPLARPMLTLLVTISVVALLSFGAWAVFGRDGPPLSADHASVVGTLDLNGTICCLERRAFDGDDYLFALVLEPRGLLSDRRLSVTLRAVAVNDDELEQVATLDAPIDSTLPQSMAIVGSTLYAPLGGSDDEPHGVWIVDISRPDTPVELDVYRADQRYRNLASGPDATLIAHAALGFTSYDVSTAAEPSPIGFLERPQADAGGLRLRDDGLFVYLAGSIMLWDFADPARPEPLGRYAGQSRGSDRRSLWSSRVESPEAFLDLHAPASGQRDFAISDSDPYMYVAASAQGLEIVDLADPAEPARLDDIALEGRAVRIAISDDELYVVSVSEESRERLAYAVDLFDLSDPEAPEFVMRVDQIRAAPGLHPIATGDGRLFLGLSGEILMLDTGT